MCDGLNSSLFLRWPWPPSSCGQLMKRAEPLTSVVQEALLASLSHNCYNPTQAPFPTIATIQVRPTTLVILLAHICWLKEVPFNLPAKQAVF